MTTFTNSFVPFVENPVLKVPLTKRSGKWKVLLPHEKSEQYRTFKVLKMMNPKGRSCDLILNYNRRFKRFHLTESNLKWNHTEISFALPITNMCEKSFPVAKTAQMIAGEKSCPQSSSVSFVFVMAFFFI